MSRRIATCVWLAAFVAAHPATGQLDLGGPPSPGAYIADTLESLEGQVADRLGELNGADPGRVVAIEAQKNYRLVARRLLTVGRDAGESGAIAVMTAARLMDAAPAVDALVDAVPRRAAAALAAESPAPAELERLKRAIAALRRFNDRADDRVDDLTGADGATVDAYVQRMLAPLAVVAKLLDQPATPAWPVVGPEGVRPARVVTRADLAALDKRVGAAQTTDATRQELRITIDRLRRARDEADLQPAVWAIYHQVVRLTDAADAFAAADWLDELSRTLVARQVHDAAALLKDPKTRDAAVARIDRLDGATAALADIGRLHAAGVNTTNLAEVFMAAYRLAADTTRADNADRLLATVGRIARTAEQQRRLKPSQLPGDIQNVFRAVQVQYANQEKRIVAALPTLATDPEQVALARWTTLVNRLEALGALTERLNRIPDWMARMKRLNPRASTGLYRQLRLITGDLLNEATHAGAAAALAEIDRQLELFEKLPHEATLDDANAPLRKGLGRHEADIRKQLLVLRSQWAAAWAARADPTEPGRKLLLMRRLFEQWHEAGALGGEGGKAGRLNRWAAWGVPAASIDPVVAELPRQLRTATAQAAAGQWQTLGTTLDAIERQAPVARLAARLMVDLGAALPGDEPDAGDALGRALFEPPASAYGRPWRAQLAQIAVRARAADHARTHGDDDRARRLRRAAGDLARQLIRRINRATDQAPAAPPFEAIDV